MKYKILMQGGMPVGFRPQHETIAANNAMETYGGVLDTREITECGRMYVKPRNAKRW